MTEVLLIDDDRELTELLGLWLQQEGFSIRACHDGESARHALHVPLPDAVILDVMLPDGSGLDLLRTLRQEFAELPVLMLSARGEPLDRVLGLELGADDYLAKPCEPRELTARLKAVLRRSRPAVTEQLLQAGDLSYSPQRGVARVRDEEIPLTVSEGRILAALLREPGTPQGKQELAREALGRALTLYDRSLDMHVSNLRRKLGNHPDGRPRILASRGRGYYYAL